MRCGLHEDKVLELQYMTQKNPELSKKVALPCLVRTSLFLTVVCLSRVLWPVFNDGNFDSPLCRPEPCDRFRVVPNLTSDTGTERCAVR
jgi:hypothetical protein